jgi:hypothetical protein
MNKDVNKDVDKDEQLNKDVNKDPADTKRWNFYFKMLHASMWYSADRENTSRALGDTVRSSGKN